MGTTGAWVALRAEGNAASTNDLVHRAEEADGWRIYVPKETFPRPSTVEESAVQLVNKTSGLGIVAFVEDSDWSYVAGVTPDGVAARVVFHADGAEDYEEGNEVLSLVAAGAGDDIARFTMFASLLGRNLTAERIREIDAIDTPFAEDCLFRLLEDLGLTLPDEAF